MSSDGTQVKSVNQVKSCNQVKNPKCPSYAYNETTIGQVGKSKSINCIPMSMVSFATAESRSTFSHSDPMRQKVEHALFDWFWQVFCK